jgi:nucleoside 2-deoxyribosyltransferase
MITNAPTDGNCKVCGMKHFSIGPSTKLKTIIASDNICSNDIYEHNCPICGQYDIRKDAFDTLLEIQNNNKEDFISFVNYVRTAKKPVEIDSPEELKNIILSNPGPRDLPERVRKVLGQICNGIKNIGRGLDIAFYRDAYLFWCHNKEELKRIIAILAEEGYIKINEGGRIVNPNGDHFSNLNDSTVFLAAKGIDISPEFNRQNNSSKCFIAMSFNETLNNLVDEVFKPAAEEAGNFIAFRIDHKEHNDNIDDHIIVEIKESRFIIADLTGQKQGVYWEAGFAEGLGKKVIYTCRKDEIDGKKVHFDLNHRNIIVWEEKELNVFKQRLVDRIKATIL